MTTLAEIHGRLKTSTAKMLGFDPGKLSPVQEAKVDMVAGLRLEQDRLTTLQLRGEPVDPKQLLMVGEALEAALRSGSYVPPPSSDPMLEKATRDFEEALGRVIDDRKRSEQEELERLRSEVASLRQELAAVTAPAEAPAAPADGEAAKVLPFTSKSAPEAVQPAAIVGACVSEPPGSMVDVGEPVVAALGGKPAIQQGGSGLQ